MTMQHDEQFDQLARRKLAEREIPFQQADWQAAKALINAKRRDRGAGMWWSALVLLLLTGAGAWFALGGHDGTPHTGEPARSGVQGTAEVAAEPKAAAPATITAQAASPMQADTGTRSTPAVESTGPRTMNGTAGISVVAHAPNARAMAAEGLAKQMGDHAAAHSDGPSFTSETTAVATREKEGAIVAEADQPSAAPGDAAPPMGTPVSFAAAPNAAVQSGGSATDRTRLPWLEIRSSGIPAPLTADSALAHPGLADRPPLRPWRTPWELSVVGGMFSTQSRYAGADSHHWASRVDPMASAALGAELLRMGRNFGMGAGLHVSTYNERIRSDALDHRSLQIMPFWYLLPVDTVILVITDTLAGQPPVYMGQSVATTVHVLAQGTDTLEQVQHLRDARDQVNRVAYWEVPLLLDAHLAQGRWSLGVRGGPTVGLLTGRRGALPYPGGEGYLDLREQPFRELVLGYGARAYLRYRFNAAWSIGVEPALRGQLSNGLTGTGLERRATAKGVMLSVGYRIP